MERNGDAEMRAKFTPSVNLPKPYDEAQLAEKYFPSKRFPRISQFHPDPQSVRTNLWWGFTLRYYDFGLS